MVNVRRIVLKGSLLVLVMFALLVGSTGVQAAEIPVAVTNGSFEDDLGLDLGSGHFLAGPIVGFPELAGWTRLQGAADDWGAQAFAGVGEEADTGEYKLLIDADVNPAFAGVAIISNVLSTNLAADTIYRLTVAVGLVGADGGAYDIALYAGATELVAGSAVGYIVTDGFLDVTITYDPTTSPATPTLGDALEIRLSGKENVGFNTGAWTRYDTVRLTADLIPEPATLAMLGLGAIAFLASRRRRH